MYVAYWYSHSITLMLVQDSTHSTHAQCHSIYIGLVLLLYNIICLLESWHRRQLVLLQVAMSLYDIFEGLVLLPLVITLVLY